MIQSHPPFFISYMMKASWHRLALAISLALFAAGCSPSGSPPVAGPRVAVVPTIQPGDEIELKIWNEPEMSDTFTVSRTGEVILPKLGSVPVSQREIEALQDSLRQEYSQFLRNPSVEVTVLRRIGVQGEVKEPGIYLVDLTMTLPDVLARAGGVTEAGDRNRITIVRGMERLRYGVSDGGRFIAAELQSGDQVIVAQRNFIARNPMAVISTAIALTTFLLSSLR